MKNLSTNTPSIANIFSLQETMENINKIGITAENTIGIAFLSIFCFQENVVHFHFPPSRNARKIVREIAKHFCHHQKNQDKKFPKEKSRTWTCSERRGAEEPVGRGGGGGDEDED